MDNNQIDFLKAMGIFYLIKIVCDQIDSYLPEKRKKAKK